MKFRAYLESSEERKDIRATLARLPAAHRKLFSGYTFKFQKGNTLADDPESVGQIHGTEITLASPWRYGREFVCLHECAHLVWQELVPPAKKKEWAALVAKLRPKKGSALDQDATELFCHAYGAYYSKHPPATYRRREWMDFIKSL